MVIGYLEPHGRADTLAQAEGLETIPRRRVSYRDAVLEEMDLPGLLRPPVDRAAPAAVGERLLALVTLEPTSQRIVRRAWRCA